MLKKVILINENGDTNEFSNEQYVKLIMIDSSGMVEMEEFERSSGNKDVILSFDEIALIAKREKASKKIFQIMAVFAFMCTEDLNLQASIRKVANKLEISYQSVVDKCTRQIGLNTAEASKLMDTARKTGDFDYLQEKLIKECGIREKAFLEEVLKRLIMEVT